MARKNVYCAIVTLMRRFIATKLVTWKQRKDRKPLILKGARQVGKTYALLAFAEAHFPQHHYFNFEKEPKLASIFDESLEPAKIIQALSLHRQTRIDIENDLIIFDEIQACPNALTSLKYFCEDMPAAYVCAAGSLLGVYLNPVSYPVGKVNHLEMYPMSFLEFLGAVDDVQYVELLQQLTTRDTIPQIAHEHLWERLQHYFIVGGLPDVVRIYCEHSDDLVTAFNLVREKQLDLIEDYFSDIAKHSGKLNAMHINRIWRNIPEQLAQTQDGSAKKFKFKGAIPGIDRYSKLADALDWLGAAGLIIKVGIVKKGALPLKAYAKDNEFKLFIFDVGILGALCDISVKTILDYSYGSYKGFYAENFIAVAFGSTSALAQYSWVEKSAEVEFIREIDAALIPIEVKSGWVTRAKSLSVFAQKYRPAYRVIMSANNMRINTKENIQYLPLYLAERFPLDET
ncbi:MAG: hypothetical protein COB66_06825 [Coxiella sp. (in: Bacteria)]|nr:MAG: hypothetical protein COB66_06825 [Coxiella sp. (in: g-proteobacteria)]